mmetsp:Transcript_9252/g.14034  ORF Transcript_9252/g.14034 Transcript_9252/m.14034 type:complete len:243 (-) Transcript_9252:72-800(-)
MTTCLILVGIFLPPLPTTESPPNRMEDSPIVPNLKQSCEIDEFNYEMEKRILEEQSESSSIFGFFKRIWLSMVRFMCSVFSIKRDKVNDRDDLVSQEMSDDWETEPLSGYPDRQADFTSRSNILDRYSGESQREAEDQVSEMYNAWKGLPLIVKLLTSPLLLFYFYAKADSLLYAAWKFPRLPSQAYEEETLPSTYEFYQMKQTNDSPDEESGLLYSAEHDVDPYTPYRPLSTHPTDEPWFI